MNFKEFLTKNENARKIFGKKELEIISKQLDGQQLTQSQKNILSRSIRQKLKFVEECYTYHKDFHLKKGLQTKNEISFAVQKILEDPLAKHIQLLLLFGSAVDMQMSYRSDIDICVVFGNALSEKEASNFRLRILSQVSSKIDVQVFELLPYKVRLEILKKNRILYKSEGFDTVQFSLKWFKIINNFFHKMKMVL